MYAKIDRSGCLEYHGNVMVRFSFYLDEKDARYKEHHIFAVDETSPEFKAGYQGKVDKLDNPVSDKGYKKWIDSCPHYWRDNPFHNHFVYADPDVSNEELQALAEYHLANFYEAWRLKKTIRSGWDTKHRIRPLRYEDVDSPQIFKQRKAQCDARVAEIKSLDISLGSLGEGRTFPATDIDIGAAATNRGAYLSLASYTAVGKENPSNDTGTIDSVEIWMFSAVSDYLQVATFIDEGSDVLTTRDYENLGACASGSKQTFSGLDMDVTTGDYLGAGLSAISAAKIEKDNSGEGYWTKNGVGNIPATSVQFTWTAGRTISLYGTGETPVVAPTVTTQAVDTIGFD